MLLAPFFGAFVVAVVYIALTARPQHVDPVPVSEEAGEKDKTKALAE
jgi:hypothetical protein